MTDQQILQVAYEKGLFVYGDLALSLIDTVRQVCSEYQNNGDEVAND